MNYQDVINSSPVVLVEFYASWCPHCRKMMPIVSQIKELLAGKADVYQFDIDENSELADSNGVNSVPTFIVYNNGEEKWRQSGEMEADVLLAHVEKYL